MYKYFSELDTPNDFKIYLKKRPFDIIFLFRGDLVIYLKSFQLPNERREDLVIFFQEKRTCFNNYYTFGIFPNRKIEKFNLDNITILYGSNGSGKSTLLNVIAEKIKSKRKLGI